MLRLSGTEGRMGLPGGARGGMAGRAPPRLERNSRKDRAREACVLIPRRANRYEDRQLDHASIRTLSETVSLSLGACWGPSSLGAAISPSVSRAKRSGQGRHRSRLDWVFLSWKIIEFRYVRWGLSFVTSWDVWGNQELAQDAFFL